MLLQDLAREIVETILSEKEKEVTREYDLENLWEAPAALQRFEDEVLAQVEDVLEQLPLLLEAAYKKAAFEFINHY